MPEREPVVRAVGSPVSAEELVARTARGDERAETRAHLPSCAGCAGEVAEFRETLTFLRPSAAAPPPADLKVRVLAAAARTRQLPPTTEPEVTPRTRQLPPTTEPEVTPRKRWRTLAIAAAGIAVIVGAQGPRRAHDQPARPRCAAVKTSTRIVPNRRPARTERQV
ncbi:hypothetical protein ACQPW3_11855 [Actinosynnema sp. CA-248983]